jgi:purine-binding chemotaxis protein CheW
MVPGTADFIKGIMPLRGEITPVLDLKERLSMKQTDITADHRILIIHWDEIQLGLIVDDVTEVKAGARDFIVKPFSPERIKEALEKVL